MTFISTKNFKGRFVFEKNDCVVVALATAFNVSYEIAHDVCRLNGRKNRDGMCVTHMLSKPIIFGKNIERINFPYYSWDRLSKDGIFTPRVNVKRFIQQNPLGIFLIKIRDHIFTIKDGIAYDYKDPQWCEIEYVIKIT